jgi:pyridoxine 5-phosphate synthase
MNDAGIAVSLFIAPDAKQIEASARTGSQFIELHTGKFAEDFYEQWGEAPATPDAFSPSYAAARGDARPTGLPELDRLIAGAKLAHSLGLKVNAGHGLNYVNLPLLFAVPHLVELNIGHSLISRAVFTGLEKAVNEMLAVMRGYSPAS